MIKHVTQQEIDKAVAEIQASGKNYSMINSELKLYVQWEWVGIVIVRGKVSVWDDYRRYEEPPREEVINHMIDIMNWWAAYYPSEEIAVNLSKMTFSMDSSNISFQNGVYRQKHPIQVHVNIPLMDSYAEITIDGITGESIEDLRTKLRRINNERGLYMQRA